MPKHYNRKDGDANRYPDPEMDFSGEMGANKLGGHGPVMGIRGLVLKSIMKKMDGKEYSRSMKGRPTKMAKGEMTNYPGGRSKPKIERYSR
jgi:hypothetical protein